MKALFFIFLLMTSCTPKAELSKQDFNLKLKGVKMDISQLHEVSWWIGAKRKEKKVTQSFTFLVDLPQVRESDLEYLMKEKNVDSWLVRVIQVKGSQSQDLGSLIVPFIPKQHARNSKVLASAHASVKIYYAAAYASERMRNFKCPAFNHNKRITSMSIKGDDDPMEITFGSSISYREKAQQMQLSPSSFNGGHSLQGQFFLALAPYDSKNQKLVGNFRQLPRYIDVEREEIIYVESCKGHHPETD